MLAFKMVKIACITINHANIDGILAIRFLWHFIRKFVISFPNLRLSHVLEVAPWCEFERTEKFCNTTIFWMDSNLNICTPDGIAKMRLIHTASKYGILASFMNFDFLNSAFFQDWFLT